MGAGSSVVLDAAALHPSLSDPALTSMTLLNDICGRYPGAVSFAAGRPTEEPLRSDSLHRHLDLFIGHLTNERDLPEPAVISTLYQYGRTKGVITDLVARHLAADEGIAVDEDAVMITTGCQEAMVLVLRALRRDERDVVLAARPTYVGFTGAARITETAVWPVREGEAGLDPADLVRQVRAARAAGLRPRACYVVPDFANPSGAVIPTDARRELLAVAEQEDLLLLEDNPYSMFGPVADRPPTLKSLDRRAQVVYLGSFAKTVYPGARVAYVVADQPMAGGGRFVDELAKLKSMLTLNTSTVAQAVVGGLLLEHGCSVARASSAIATVHRRNRRLVLDGLAARLGDVPGVSWNAPAGGMFVVLTVPFVVDDAALEDSARRYGVLWTPMTHFYTGAGGHHQLRLSFGGQRPAEMGRGLDRLAAFVTARAHRPVPAPRAVAESAISLGGGGR
jgi:(S)-3,5-dihydroxyphenylglycine transaminase